MSDALHDRIADAFSQSVEAITLTQEMLSADIAHAAEMINSTLLAGGKVMICGNGGSASNAQHFASEMINRFEQERPGLPAIALGADGATLTAIANDAHFNEIFARQIRVLGQPGDLLLCMSTHGESTNVLAATAAAHDREMAVIALTGADGGTLASMLEENDAEIRVPAGRRARIQETHLLVLHCLLDLVDHQLFG